MATRKNRILLKHFNTLKIQHYTCKSLFVGKTHIYILKNEEKYNGCIEMQTKIKLQTFYFPTATIFSPNVFL